MQIFTTTIFKILKIGVPGHFMNFDNHENAQN